MSSALAEQAEYEYLQTPRAIRECCDRVLEAARAGELEHWRLDESKLPEVAARVATLTQQNYPDLTKIPYHGRYRHFGVGGVPRLAQFDAKNSAVFARRAARGALRIGDHQRALGRRRRADLAVSRG